MVVSYCEAKEVGRVRCLWCYPWIGITEFRLGADDIPQVRRNQLGLQSGP